MNYPIHDPGNGVRQPRLGALDVQPILERRDDSIWAHVEQARDALYEVLQQACAQEGFEALVIKSDPFVQPAWVKLECWIPRNPEFGRMVTGRGWAVVTIEAKEFHRYRLEYRVEVHDRGWSKTYHRLREFGPEQAGQVARFLLSGGPKPDLAVLGLRRMVLEVWKPANKVDVLSLDWLGLTPTALASLGLFLIGQAIGIPPLLLLLLLAAALGFAVLRQVLGRRSAVARAQRQPVVSAGLGLLTLALGLFVSGPLLGLSVIGLALGSPVPLLLMGTAAFALLGQRRAVAQASRTPGTPPEPQNGMARVVLAGLGVVVLAPAIVTVSPLSLAFLVWAVVASYLLRRRRAVVLSSGKPQGEPRDLHIVDSWQVAISGLGNDAALLRERFHAVVRNPPITGCQARVERIWHWGLDGKVEREQIVLTLRRVLVFCQIYEYDQELYVGWNAHLNSGQWVEKTVFTGIHKQTGELTRVNTVESGSQALGQYDLTDVNCLLEWTHAQLVRLLQRLKEERDIDQEIDFTIIRGVRQGLTETGMPAVQGGLGAVRRLLRIG
ncbi:MAG: hypothetical protein ACRD0K_15320 [Egibacteraceae bacterium]